MKTLAVAATVLAALATATPAQAATPTPTTPANNRTFGSCTTTAPGGQYLIGTALADSFFAWRGTRLGALGTSARTATTRTVFLQATLAYRDRAGNNVLTSMSAGGYWLIPRRDPQPGDRIKVTIHWQTKRLGLPAGRPSCEAYLVAPRNYGNLV